MAKDFVTGRKTTFGKKRSHALNQTNRSWKPNLQKVRILVDGKPKKVWEKLRPHPGCPDRRTGQA